MELFSEVYGLYYHMVHNILTKAHEEAITKQHILNIIQEKGFGESLLTLTDRLMENGKDDSYNLLVKGGNGYRSILSSSPLPLITTLEKMWLKSILKDKRVALFFEDEELAVLARELEDVDFLFEEEALLTIGQANDGDPYDDTDYLEHFRKILYAITHKKLLNITYLNSKGIKKWGSYAPYRLEYSIKDDKFRLNTAQIDRGKLLYYSKVNLARIVHVEIIEEASYPSGVSDFIHSHRKPEPIEIELNNERNGFERCFLHLSNYERNSEYDEETGTCRIKIYYYDVDEMELLITLLSYGPILKVLGPESFKAKFIKRLYGQKELFQSNINPLIETTE